jgi:ribonuclease-3
MNDLKTFQENNHITFKDQSLLLRALTHASYLNEHPRDGLEDNERLEFLGDAVLDFISGELLYHRFPEAPEGYLTRLRAALVRTETLAEFARECEIGETLLLGHGEAENGGRIRNGNLCAAFEAVTGALYLDQGVGVVREFVLPFFENTLEEIVRDELDKDPKSKLQEWTQANLGLTPSYQTVDSRGPDHQKIFTVAVSIGDKVYAQGVGASKQTAAQQAAEQALEILNK